MSQKKVVCFLKRERERLQLSVHLFPCTRHPTPSPDRKTFIQRKLDPFVVSGIARLFAGVVDVAVVSLGPACGLLEAKLAL